MLIRVALILAAVNLSACSYFPTRRSPTQETKVTLKDAQGNSKEAPAQPTTTGPKEITPIKPDDNAEADAKAKAQEMREAVAAAAEHIQQTHGKPSREAGPVPAEKSLGWLKNGNTRFVTGHVRKDGATAKDRARLSSEQTPHAIVLSCSDSRVPPEVVFDQKLGEIYVVRTVGEALDNNVIGSIEHAVSFYGSNLIVVMGHESCSAIRGAMSALKGAVMGSPAINAIVADIKPRLQKYASTAPSAGYLDESWANVDGIAHDLAERSQILRDAVASGEVKIVRAMYHLDSGNVEWQQ